MPGFFGVTLFVRLMFLCMQFFHFHCYIYRGGCSTFSLYILLLIDICIVSSSWLLWIILLELSYSRLCTLGHRLCWVYYMLDVLDMMIWIFASANIYSLPSSTVGQVCFSTPLILSLVIWILLVDRIFADMIYAGVLCACIVWFGSWVQVMHTRRPQSHVAVAPSFWALRISTCGADVNPTCRPNQS